LTKSNVLRIPLIALVLTVWLGGCGDAGSAEQSAEAATHRQSSADNGETAGTAPETRGFAERGREAGIRFKMAFLPGEQGATFKVNLYDHGSGVVVGDIDGDGFDDIYLLNQLGPNALFRNNGDGTFRDQTATAGPIALADRICTAAAFNDIDNDGDQDLFVASTRGGNALFRNDGTGKFREVTKEAGVEWIGHSQGVAFFDADHDGDLDLLVTNTARWTTERFEARDRYYEGPPSLLDLVDSPVEPNVYYRNDGTGKFENATEESGLGGPGWGGDMAVFDYDGDGKIDIFVGNMFGGNRLYRNDGKGHFEDVTAKSLGATPWGSMGTRAFDYDGDGLLDLMIVDMHSDMWMQPQYSPSRIREAKKYPGALGRTVEELPNGIAAQERYHARLKIREGTVFFGNGLYRNRGDGTFEEVSGKAGAETFWPWGIAAADFDNNGAVDAFLPSGMGYPYFYWRNYLLMNDGKGKFVDQSRSTGIDPPPGGTIGGQIGGRSATRSARSAAVLDVENDGRLDLIVNNFNDRAHLFGNRWSSREYVAFRLRGTRSNRDAVGAVVRIYSGARVQVRQVQAATGYLAQSSKTLHFGLDGFGEVERAEIRWPSGLVQTIASPAHGQIHEVVEPAR